MFISYEHKVKIIIFYRLLFESFFLDKYKIDKSSLNIIDAHKKYKFIYQGEKSFIP